MVINKDSCRVCRSRELYDFFDLGHQPAANTLLTSINLTETEFTYPLVATVCPPCGFMQLKHVVAPEVLFRHYQYMASASRSYLEHFGNLATVLISQLNLKQRSLVVDIGSNDGSLLKEFAKRGMAVLGVDPAKNLAELANKEGMETVCDYFTPAVARTIMATKGPAKLITATNVFAHVDDLTTLIEAISTTLDHDGVFVAQFPYLGDLITKNAFDTIYHEHLSYFSIFSLARLFDQTSLELYQVEHIPIHGGSLRIFARKRNNATFSPAIRALLKKEKQLKLHNQATYEEFARRARRIKRDLKAILNRLAKEKKMVIGLGAPAKGITLINYTGLTPVHIRFITDSTPAKHGHFTPQSRIPIVPEKLLKDHHIDYAIIFAWNFADEIMKKTRFIQKRGGRYIIPIPNVTVL